MKWQFINKNIVFKNSMLSDGEFVDQPTSFISLSCLHKATVFSKTLVLWFKNTL